MSEARDNMLRDHTLRDDALRNDVLLVGIDLGTTNSAMAVIDPARVDAVTTQPITQHLAAGEWGTASTLPSFVLFPDPMTDALRPPWPDDAKSPTDRIVGTAARDLGRLRPGRLVASGKSWLCHPGVDRAAAILPWHGETDCPRISPVDAAVAILSHLRRAWDAEHPDRPLAEQEVIVTLPASFDEVARSLTVKAAQKAGLPRVLLIEEPQAAFYAWMHRHADWAERVRPGQTVLVCDIGGGTSDFSLIEARPTRDGRVGFQRRAVGEHLLLGGDNLDAALAAHIEPLMRERHGELSPQDFNALVAQCRPLKEQLFSEGCPAEVSIALPGRGRGLVASTRSLTLDADELRALLLDGFLPECELDATPAEQQSGFQEFGLPYASDPAITRHLAAFLSAHGRGSKPVRPDHVLFNGGFFAADRLRERLVATLRGWFPDHEVSALDHDDLYQAVARGAACYGRARRGLSEKIAAGLPRTFYIGAAADESTQAVCVAPAGLEPGESVRVEQPTFRLQLARPVEFPVYSSATRLDDEPGTLVAADPEQLHALPPIRTVLRSRKTSQSKDAGNAVAVRIESEVSEIGTLQLGCREIDGDRRWQLQFDVRSATQTDRVGHAGTGEAAGIVEAATLDAVRATIDGFGRGEVSPKRLMKELERAADLPRDQWPPTLLRAMWEAAIDLTDAIRTRPGGEPRWLHLLGFALRPGHGVALDDWRAGMTFKRIHGRLKSPQSVDAARILWRRIAGGLTGGQQIAIAEPVLAQRRDGRFDLSGQSVAEVWRMLAAFERLPPAVRESLARDAAAASPDDPDRVAFDWALARLLARVPTLGGLDTVLPPTVCEAIVPGLLDRFASATAHRGTPPPSPAVPDASGGGAPTGSAASADPLLTLAIVQACRLTGDRFRDVPAALRERAAVALRESGAAEELLPTLESGQPLPVERQAQTLGDSLPPGLTLA